MKRYISLQTLVEVRTKATAQAMQEGPRRSVRTASGIHERSDIEEALRRAILAEAENDNKVA